jgi:hypothetical protein
MTEHGQKLALGLSRRNPDYHLPEVRTQEVLTQLAKEDYLDNPSV